MLESFQPQGLTQLIAVTTSPSAAVQLSAPTVGVRIKADAQVYFAFGSSAGSSSLQASIPTTSTPANGIPLVASAPESFNIGPNAWLSFISTATANVNVTGGFGV